RTLRACPRGHPVPRRDRGGPSRDPAQAPARPPGERVRARRRDADGADRRANRGGDQPRPRGRGGGGPIPSGSLLPARRLPDRDPSPARAQERHRAARAIVRRRGVEAPRKERRWLLPSALARLPAYDWPGNVRELYNVIERASIVARQELLQDVDLP